MYQVIWDDYNINYNIIRIINASFEWENNLQPVY